MPLNLSRLNANQREAVLHGNGPLLVLAGAGSGKTSTMAYRIAHLVSDRHVPGTDILGLSFTNKAAGELKERVWSLLTEGRRRAPAGAKGLTVTTFHSLCVRILREHGIRLGFQKNFSILDRHDQKDILREIFKQVRIDDRKFDLDTILFEIGQAKSRFQGPEEAEAAFLENRRIASDYAIAAASSYGHYQDRLKALNAMDFDDLLFHGVRLLERFDEVRNHYNARFRHILVDEYQDTNATQFRLLRLLTERQQNLCVVGDDDQSIYSWRGADPSHILEFSRQFPGARVITLDQNYRSVSTILDAANHVISNNPKRHPKKLWSDRGPGAPLAEIIVEEDRAEGEFVANDIQRRARDENRPWRDFAVLYRSNAQSRIFEEAFRRNQVPYAIVGGMSFLDRKEVKDTLSYWRLVANPKDDASLRRILNWPARGLGKTAVEALGTYAFEKNVSLFEALSEAPRVVPKAAAAAISLRDLIRELRRTLELTPASGEGLATWARGSLSEIGAKAAIEKEDEDDPAKAARRWESVEELVHSLGQIRPSEAPTQVEEAPFTEGLVAAAASAPSIPSREAPAALEDYLSRMALQAQEDEEDREEKDDSEKDQVTLLTLHGAKGLEYPIVYLVGMEDGILPHRRAIDEGADLGEERRLCYVGVTRARDQLYLTRARNRVRYGKAVPRIRSRFLDEIPAELLVRQDESYGPDASDSDAARAAHEAKVKDFLAGIRGRLSGPKA